MLCRLIIFIILLIVITHFNPASSSSHILYVSITGDDVTANGNQSWPFRTVSKAVSNSNNGDTILITPGHYNDSSSLTVSHTLSIMGIGGEGVVILSCHNRVGPLLTTSGALSLTNIRITNCTSTDRGGAIGIVSNHVNASLDRVFMDHNHGTTGGAIFSMASSLMIRDSTFSNNFAADAGGAIFMAFGGTSSSSKWTNVTFVSNHATQGGGAVSHYYAPLEMVQCKLENNRAEKGGGAIMCSSTLLTITTTTISDNCAGEDGSSIMLMNCNYNISRSSFLRNQATDSGGIYVQFLGLNTNGPHHVSECTFDENTVGDKGGALYCKNNGRMILSDSIITRTIAQNGAVQWRECDGSYGRNVTFASNQANEGGGMFLRGNNYVIDKCTFVTKRATSLGGGVYNEASNVVLSDSRFIENKATNSGGGIYTTKSSTLRDLTLRNNVAQQHDGGGVYSATGAQITAVRITFLNNSAVYGGGIWSGSETHAITSSNFTDNHASKAGESWFIGTRAYVSSNVCTNCVFEGSVSSELIRLFVEPATVLMRNFDTIVVKFGGDDAWGQSFFQSNHLTVLDIAVHVSSSLSDSNLKPPQLVRPSDRFFMDANTLNISLSLIGDLGVTYQLEYRLSGRDDGKVASVYQNITILTCDQVAATITGRPMRTSTRTLLNTVWQECVPQPSVLTVSMSVYIGTVVVAALALSAAAVLMVSVYRHRHALAIKAASPPLLLCMASGIVPCVILICLSGLEGKAKVNSTLLCHSQIILLHVSFSIILGSLFVRVYRVDNIFNNRSLAKRPLVLTNISLVTQVVALVLVDVVYGIVWLFVNPLSWQTKVISGGDTAILGCHSRHQQWWHAGLGTSKGLLLLWGIYLSYRARTIHHASFQEGKQLALAIYNVAMVVLMGLPLVLLLREHPQAQHIIITCVLLYLSCATLGIVIMPKLWNVWYPHQVVPISILPGGGGDGNGTLMMKVRVLSPSSQHSANDDTLSVGSKGTSGG